MEYFGLLKHDETMDKIKPVKLKQLLSMIVIASMALQGSASAVPTAIPSDALKPGSVVTPPSIESLVANPTDLTIPFESVSLKEVHAGSNGKLIIHIQDAHSNFSGQMSLAKAMDFFIKKYGITLVLTEGADRDVTLTDAKGITDQETWC